MYINNTQEKLSKRCLFFHNPFKMHFLGKRIIRNLIWDKHLSGYFQISWLFLSLGKVKWSNWRRKEEKKPRILLVTCSLEVMIWSMSVRIVVSKGGRPASQLCTTASYWAWAWLWTRPYTASDIWTQTHWSKAKLLEKIRLLTKQTLYYCTTAMSIK